MCFRTPSLKNQDLAFGTLAIIRLNCLEKPAIGAKRCHNVANRCHNGAKKVPMDTTGTTFQQLKLQCQPEDRKIATNECMN
jgi:hypothetical protein